MQATAPFRTIACLSHAPILINPILKFNLCDPNSIISPKSLLSTSCLSHGMLANASIVYARRKKRRTGFQISTKLMIELASSIASNLKILPPPLDLVIAEFSGGDGNGGGVGLWKGFDGGGYGGWRRKRKNNALLVGFLAIFCLALLFFTELEVNAVCGALGFGLFCFALIQFWQKRGITVDFLWGFFLSGFLVALVFRRRFELQKWVRKIRTFKPKMKFARGKNRAKRVF